MTKRERILAIVVGTMVALIGAMYFVRSVSSAFTDREDLGLQLESDVARQRRDILFGNEAATKLSDLSKKSLPADIFLARSAYQKWLLELAAEKVLLEDIRIDNQLAATTPDLSSQYRFDVTCFGSLEQVVDFMYQFHRADYLHRIGNLRLMPQKDSNQLKITMRIDCLSLLDTENTNLPERAPSERLPRDKDEYVQMIAHRNPFARANQAPKFARLGPQSANPNRPVSISVAANDADERDQVRYSFVGEPPKGATIDPASGQIRFTPTALGDVEFAVRATDDGLPPLSDEITVRINVREPTPVARAATPAFDPATQAFVTGITESGNVPKLWVQVRTEGRALRLSVGDRVEVGTVEGVVSKINLAEREAEIETDAGKVITVSLGDSLVPEKA